MSVLGTLFDVFLLLVTPVLVLTGVIAAARRQAISFSLRGWLRFPLAVVLTFGLEFALAGIFLAVNPYLYESTHRPVLIVALASLGYLCSHIPISLISLARPDDHHELKLLFQAYTFWWFFLALPFGWLVGRAYSRLIFIALSSALLAGLFDRWYAAGHGGINLDEDHEAPLLQPQRTESPAPAPPCESSSSDSSSDRRHECAVKWKTSAISGAFDIPFILLLGTQLAFLFHLATRADYESIGAAFVQTTLAVICVVLPLAPFTHHFHRVATTTIALVLVACTILAVATFPFSRATPLRLQFSHSIDLVDGSTFTELAGPHGYFESHVKPSTNWRGGNDVWLQLPPSRPANCTKAIKSKFHENELPNAYGICRWPGPTTRMWPWPPSHWITDFDKKPLGLTRGVLVVSGPSYTHFQSLSLDRGVVLDSRNIYSEELSVAKVSEPGDDGRRGVPWERIFIVEWDPTAPKGKRGGFVVVGWDESPDPGDVPDLHALRAGVPDWVRVTGPRGNTPQVDGFRRFDF